MRTSYSDYFLAIAPTLDTGPSTSSLSEAAGGAGAEAELIDTQEGGSVRPPSWWRKILARMRREDRESYACYVLMVIPTGSLNRKACMGATGCTLLHHKLYSTASYVQHYKFRIAFVVLSFVDLSSDALTENGLLLRNSTHR